LNPDLLLSLVFAALMVAVPSLALLVARLGWADTREFSGRALLTIVAAYIVVTGNSIPKRLTPRACLTADPGKVQAYMRFAGWTWVLAGLALGIVSVLLPAKTAAVATLVIMPVAIALIAFGCLRLYRVRRPAA
jgi:hypothetical protein